MPETPWKLINQTLGVAPVVSMSLSSHPACHVERYFFQARRQTIPALPCLALAIHLGGARVSGGDAQAQRASYIPSFSMLIPANCATEWIFEGAVDVGLIYFPDSHSPRMRNLIARLENASMVLPFRDGLVSAAMLNMVDELGYGNDANASFAKRLVMVVLDQIERILTHRAGLHISPDRLQLGRLRMVLDWINENLAETITNADMAHMVHLSESHFRHMFIQAMGMSPGRYVQQRRIERAHELIATTNLPIISVASECGFVSQSYLTTCFKSKYGMTPARFRRGAPS